MNRQIDESGFALVESLAALMVLLILLPALGRLAQMGYDEVQKRVVASHLAQVTDAAAAYVREHHATLVTSATTTGSVQISMDQLAPHLPHGFQDRNAWGQSYGIYVLQPSSGSLQAVVLTREGRSDGTEFQNLHVPGAAAMAGAAGGFVPSGDMSGQPSTTLQGAFGGWKLDLTGTDIPNPGPGHLVGMVSLSGADLAQDCLYRVSVPGHPELNAMQAELDMTGHAVRGIRELQFNPHALADFNATACTAETEGRVFFDPDEGLYVCRGEAPQVLADTANSQLFKDARLAADGEFIPKPECPAGVSTSPGIFVSPAAFAEGAQANALVAVQAWATDTGDSWQVHLRLKNAKNEWVSPPPELGRVMVLTTCN